MFDWPFLPAHIRIKAVNDAFRLGDAWYLVTEPDIQPSRRLPGPAAPPSARCGRELCALDGVVVFIEVYVI